MTATARVASAGDSAVVVRLGNEISQAMLDGVMSTLRALDALRAPGVLDVVPGYASVMVIFEPEIVTPQEIRQAISLALSSARSTAGSSAGSASASPSAALPVEIPVLYDPEDPAIGPDLLALAASASLTPADVIRLHTAPVYRCHLLGFRPGFPFLGGLDPRLHSPRLSTPRLQVAAGSVGIGGRQTGIYPQSGPGGWRIIGRTPLRLFDPQRPRPFLVAPGDAVKLVAIDRAAFQQLAGQPTS